MPASTRARICSGVLTAGPRVQTIFALRTRRPYWATRGPPYAGAVLHGLGVEVRKPHSRSDVHSRPTYAPPPRETSLDRRRVHVARAVRQDLSRGRRQLRSTPLAGGRPTN